MTALPLPLPFRVPQTAAAVLLGFALTTSPSARAQQDHSFLSSYEGTTTCLNCHGEGKMFGDKAAEVMATVHWTWEHVDSYSGQTLGKRNVINNYCVAVPSNEPRCTSCHVGIGWRDDSFDFTDPTRVDCLVCHDTTGNYKKTPTGAGEPDPTVDLLEVAKNVGPTSRATCGSCHFYGGGGDAVKHGDLDSTMTNPLRSVDVHMGTDGANRNCSYCHNDGSHRMIGSRYSKSGPDSALCQDCHGASPHASPTMGERLNTHATRVACQSCHIPHSARGGKGTKMHWDWSTAGQKNPDGSLIVTWDADGNETYNTKKGSFVWEENFVPEYVWFNGNVVYSTLEDVFAPDDLVTINKLQGDVSDPNARLVPVKRFTGRQPYDLVNGTLAVPHLFPSSPTDTDAYWKGYDWNSALTAGMASVGKTFGGTVGWIQSEMFWVQNHMVAPKEHALTCSDCHTPRGRLDFAGLGYTGDRAILLQNLAGFEIAMEPAAGDPSVVTLRWTATPGHQYTVQENTDLTNPAGWSTAPDGTLSSGDTIAPMSWTAPSPGDGQVKFYRVRRTDM